MYSNSLLSHHTNFNHAVQDGQVERLAQLVWLLQQDFVHEVELVEGGEMDKA